MLKISIEGNTIKEIGTQLEEMAAVFSATGRIDITADVKAAAAVEAPAADSDAAEEAPKKDKKATGKKSKDTGKKADKKAEKAAASTDAGLQLGKKSATRNTWVLLTNGSVYFVASGSAMPEDDTVAKRITKTEYEEIAADEPERVIEGNGGQAEKHQKAAVDKKKATKKDDKKKADKKKAKPAPEPEPEDDDDDEDYTEEEVLDMVADAKGIEGGKKFIKRLYKKYDVKKATALDEDELQDFADEVADWLDENEDE